MSEGPADTENIRAPHSEGVPQAAHWGRFAQNYKKLNQKIIKKGAGYATLPVWDLDGLRPEICQKSYSKSIKNLMSVRPIRQIREILVQKSVISV